MEAQGIDFTSSSKVLLPVQQQASSRDGQLGLECSLESGFVLVTFFLFFRSWCVTRQLCTVPHIDVLGPIMIALRDFEHSEPSMALPSASSFSTDRQDHSSSEFEGKMPPQVQDDGTCWEGSDLGQALWWSASRSYRPMQKGCPLSPPAPLGWVNSCWLS